MLLALGGSISSPKDQSFVWYWWEISPWISPWKNSIGTCWTQIIVQNKNVRLQVYTNKSLLLTTTNFLEDILHRYTLLQCSRVSDSAEAKYFSLCSRRHFTECLSMKSFRSLSPYCGTPNLCKILIISVQVFLLHLLKQWYRHFMLIKLQDSWGSASFSSYPSHINSP